MHPTERGLKRPQGASAEAKQTTLPRTTSYSAFRGFIKCIDFKENNWAYEAFENK